MDPNLYSEVPGLRPDSRSTSDGANYLRRLKTDEDQSVAAPASGQSAKGYSGQERRRSPRFRCNGSVEFKPEGSDVRMWGTLTDVSLHGCYVEMTTTFPVGTKVELTLEAMGIRVHAVGTVRVSYPFLGMGICLNNLEPGQQGQLQQMLSAVVGNNATSEPGLMTGAGAENAAMADPAVVLDELKQFFVKKRVLSREEFFQILERRRRS